MATLSGASISTAMFAWPRHGLWVFEGVLADPVDLTGAVSLTIGDLTLPGTVVRGGPVEGSARYLVHGGAGGWRKPIGPKSYRNDLGVKLSTVLRDVARDAGEKLDLDPALDRVLGVSWVRRAGLAWDVFGRLGLPWWVDGAGVTQVRVRPSPAVSAPSRLITWDRGKALREVAAESIAPFAPGALFEGSAIEEVTIHIEHTATRLRVRA